MSYIKYVLVLLVLSISSSALAGSVCKQSDIIYYAINKKHTKEIEICLNGDKVSYRFGKVNSQQPELYFVKNKADVIKEAFRGDGYGYDEINMINFSYIYTVAIGLHENTNIDSISVYKGTIDKKGSTLAIIEIDPKTIILNTDLIEYH